MSDFSSPRDLSSPTGFRVRVLKVLTASFPELSFVEGEQPETIRSGDHLLSLERLRHQLGTALLTDEELTSLLRRHFHQVFHPERTRELPDWDKARPLLRPQLVLAQFATTRPLLAMPLDDQLHVGVVLDEPEAFRYVPRAQLEHWGVSWEQVYAIALENLETAASEGLTVECSPPPDRLVVVQSGDGYDAVRILMPRFRAFVSEQVGSPFRFSVPNRDQLICWAEDNSPSFELFLKERLQQDQRDQPFPLTPTVYRASAAAIVPWTHTTL